MATQGLGRAVAGQTTGVSIKKGTALEDLVMALGILADVEVLVGYPEDGDSRTDASEPTNAQLAYIHDNGAPEANIPARPFMIPGVESARDKIIGKLDQTLRAVIRGGGAEKALQGVGQAGFEAMVGIKRTINEGVPPPLSERTLRERMRSGRRDGGGARKGAAQELDRRWDGQAPSVEFAKPLVDTGQLRNAVTYVVGSRSKRMKKGSSDAAD